MQNSNVTLTSTEMGNAFLSMLEGSDIKPGDQASYELCKQIYLYHPLGAKMVDGPINIAQSQQREIVISEGPEEDVKKAFLEEWKAIKADNLIFNLMILSRIYGIGSIVMLAAGVPPDRPIPLDQMADLDITFNILDPLNTAGSLVLNQEPNSPNFMKAGPVTVQGTQYHRSRTCVIMHGEPIYISYTTSAFGFVGRSVYQRALYPMRSFIESMRTDDLVVRKAGVLIAMMKFSGSVVDKVMQGLASIKRNMLKEAQTTNVISIGHDEKVESLNLQNTDTAMKQGRTNILENIAVAADMPAKLLNSETFAEGFGEGTEDAKMLARFIEGIREEMAPAYAYFDDIVMRRAWSPAFFETMQAKYPDEYGDKGYLQTLMQWRNSFSAEWPNLLIEPESERVKVEKVKNEALLSFVQVLLPTLDPENKARLIEWAQDNFNEQKLLFPIQLTLDTQALMSYVPPAPADNEPGKVVRLGSSI